MNEITISNINNDKFNPFGATSEELLANALDEAGLINKNTSINGMPASHYYKSYYDKRENYRELTKLGNLLIKNEVINQDQLRDALEYQKNHPDIKIGTILLSLNICSLEDIEKCVNAQTQIREGIKELTGFKDKIANLTDKLRKYF